MSRQDTFDGSREGLLSAQEGAPLRASSEEALESSSELGQELYELDPLEREKPEYVAHDGQQRQPRLESGLPSPSYKTKNNSQQTSPLRKLGRCLWPHSTCLIIAIILIAGALLLIGGGGLWVYKSAPRDGVGQPASQKWIKLTPVRAAITTMVSHTPRRHGQIMARELSKGGSHGQRDEFGGESQRYHRYRLDVKYVCGNDGACQSRWLSVFMPTRWPARSSLCRPRYCIPCCIDCRGDMEPGPDVSTRKSTWTRSETERCKRTSRTFNGTVGKNARRR